MPTSRLSLPQSLFISVLNTPLQITYIFHSGFLIETATCLLVFDYWLDPSYVIPRMLRPDQSKPIYVFVSHFHEDHFTPGIFAWRKQVPRVTYLLSKDVLKHRRAQAAEADVWLAKGASWQNEHLKVWATGSNDSGVSWIVEVEGKRLFHAGDLCNWYARFLADTPPPTCVPTEFGTQVNPLAEEKRYLGELKDIRKLTDRFDVVFFPVDARIGNGYTLGARQFIARFQVGLFVPMHFVLSGFESVWRMEPYCQEKNIPFWRINREGAVCSFPL